VSLTVLSADPIVLLTAISAILGGLMAGFFFAYSVSVVLALDTLPGSDYTLIMQQINEKVLNVVFGGVFFGAVVVPTGTLVYVLVFGQWTSTRNLWFIAGLITYLLGTFMITMRIHIPMNNEIARWSPDSPPEDWQEIRTRWARWNHVRAVSSAISFVFYLASIVPM
jgi:uncharacterized membrane protein